MELDQLRFILSSVHEFCLNPYTREIYLHGYHASGGDDVVEPGVEYRMATMLVKNLNMLNQIGDGDIIIHQHSIGGIWTDGIAIYDALVASRCKTIMVAHAQASSMSSITLQGAGLRLLMPNVEFLVHHGTFGTYGIPSQVASAVIRSEKINVTALDIYAKRCINGEFFKKEKMGLEAVNNFIKEKIEKHTDWFMSAKEAIYYGFADGIIGEDGYTLTFKKEATAKGKAKGRKRN